jgi:hypothetical protein
LPSGDHIAERTYSSFSAVSERGFFPSAFISQRLSMPLRSVVKAIVLPSGE